jgi:flagellar biosynthesis/type III secretory pathway chaperone
VDQQACRAQLARLLADESALLGQLERQLHSEHEFLKSNDVDGLEQAGTARQETIAKLLRIEDERRNLCRATGRGSDRNALAALFAWCDPQGSLAAPQSTCAQLAERCRAQNERNGALVTARLKRVTGMLDMLADGTTTRTYQPRATRFAAPPAGRMVSITA